ncbi:MAG: cobalamin-dependent protein, partial [Candidatus Eisenbacteria bacterium]|nr:cobalamin-dependent protein [Candidatus Eisenbacteria bacterium]
ESGHRRYTTEQVRWLRRVAEALALGYRPSKVVPLSAPKIAALIDEGAAAHDARPAVSEVIRCAAAFDGPGIRRILAAELAARGPRGLLEQLIAPVLEAIGDRWVKGELDIRHERFVSGLLGDELREIRRGLPIAEDAPLAVFATLSGEDHDLGIQMAATVGKLDGLDALLLGTGLPHEQIAEAASEMGARVVALSVSLATGGVQTDRVVLELRRLLPSPIRLVVGGRGARGVRRGPRGVDYLESFDEFGTWIRRLDR